MGPYLSIALKHQMEIIMKKKLQQLMGGTVKLLLPPLSIGFFLNL